MSENSIHVSNTPIFDQLVAELAARGKRYENLVANPPEHLRRIPKSESVFTAPGAWMAKPVPKIAPKPNARLKVNVHPLDAEKDCGSWEQFVRARLDEFNRKHPNAMNVTMHTSERFADGTIDITIEGVEVPGVKLVKKPGWSDYTQEKHTAALPPGFQIEAEKWADAAMAWVHHMYGDFVRDHPNAVITSSEFDNNGTMVLHATEPKTGHIDESLAAQQLAAYRSAVGAMKLYGQPEQTDDSVNAALNDEIRPQHVAPRPLWDTSKDDADEE